MRMLILFLLLSMGLPAAPMLTIDNPNLNLAPGESGEWQCHLQSDETRWLSVTSSFLLFETNPPLGEYEDEIGMQGGPDGRLSPAAPNWTGILGRYTVSPAATIGAFNSAVLVVLFELFSNDPAICDSCLVASSSFHTTVSVTVVEPSMAEVPEPGAWQLLGAGLGLLGLARWRRKRC